ncbi:uncharacterized protein MONBRDRAFT_24510 [Monosiga brevicollis MX1]|uniref:Fork-head domain-containing protein n=1 Tax=Monosiga brevicollis TaxID=81824 RepID=A9UWM8_MONBE|nr:uncharacterized protein MONBRDRAFT_24510 [Monosiga brevicollis MX1]EDQ90072.1 predicted protein [Monosiga brevicollis MX1]|eukprot:XP_001744839.1 hypothetical protein [Monosiga brevicollis MX1]
MAAAANWQDDTSVAAAAAIAAAENYMSTIPLPAGDGFPTLSSADFDIPSSSAASAHGASAYQPSLPNTAQPGVRPPSYSSAATPTEPGSPPHRSSATIVLEANDVDEEEDGKPALSYAKLAALAIDAAPQGRATVADIYKWVQERYPYFRHGKPWWKNCIRHNLSMKKCFVRQEGTRGSNFWSLHPDHRSEILHAKSPRNLSRKRRRASMHATTTTTAAITNTTSSSSSSATAFDTSSPTPSPQDQYTEPLVDQLRSVGPPLATGAAHLSPDLRQATARPPLPDHLLATASWATAADATFADTTFDAASDMMTDVEDLLAEATSPVLSASDALLPLLNTEETDALLNATLNAFPPNAFHSELMANASCVSQVPPASPLPPVRLPDATSWLQPVGALDLPDLSVF